MTTTDLTARVIWAISAISMRAEEDIKPEHTLGDDLCMDSLDLIELVMLIEEDFEVEVSDKDAELCVTVADVLALVWRLAS